MRRTSVKLHSIVLSIQNLSSGFEFLSLNFTTIHKCHLHSVMWENIYSQLGMMQI